MRVRFGMRTLIVAIVILCGILAILTQFSPTTNRGAFYWTTGLILPQGALQRVEDSTIGWPGDGRVLMVARVAPAVVERWTQSSPPWSKGYPWRRGRLETTYSLALLTDCRELKKEFWGKEVFYDVRPGEFEDMEFDLIVVTKEGGVVLLQVQ